MPNANPNAQLIAQLLQAIDDTTAAFADSTDQQSSQVQKAKLLFKSASGSKQKSARETLGHFKDQLLRVDTLYRDVRTIESSQQDWIKQLRADAQVLGAQP